MTTKNQTMKIVFLAPANSIHTVRWVNSLSEHGQDIYLITCHPPTEKISPRVNVFITKNKGPLAYIFSCREVKRLISLISPDIVNAHFASGYGTLARLVDFQPTMLSVWGTDVYQFPQKSFMHKFLIRKNLEFATSIGSTSHCMAQKTKETYNHSSILITPFGIDELLFSFSEPFNSASVLVEKFIIGTVKTLDYIYGVDTLIKAFALTYFKMNKPRNLFLEIYGDGRELVNLKKLTKELKIEKQVSFLGKVEHSEVPSILRRFQFYVALSRFESFGVAILEANACGKPVVVSEAEGPSEVCIHNKTGLIVPINNPDEASNAFIKLINDPNMLREMSFNARNHIEKNYTWKKSIDTMIQSYQKTIAIHKGTK